MKEVSEIIRDLLKRTGWSQTELADRSSLETHHINEIINKKRSYEKTTFATLEKIAAAFGVSVDVFSSGVTGGIAEDALPDDERELLRLFRQLKNTNRLRAPGVISYVDFNIQRARREDRKQART